MLNYEIISIYDWNALIDKAINYVKNKHEELALFGYQSSNCLTVEHYIFQFKNGNRSKKMYENLKKLIE